jgi:hypothetical protein
MFDTEPTPSPSDTSPLLMVLVTLISLNLHGMLWIFPPKLPISTKASSDERRVKLVQLTPGEMRRITEFSRPSLPLPPQLQTGEPARSNIPLPEPPSKPLPTPTPTPTTPTPPIPTPTPTATATPTPPIPTPTATTPPSFQDSLVKSRYGYNPTGTTEAEEREKLDAWLRNNKRFSRRIIPRPPIPHSIASPVGEKLPDTTPAGVAVLVSPKGKIMGEPELIRSTGYPKLNQAAIEDIKQRSFPATGDYVAYQYRVEIESNKLPSPPTNLPSNPTPSPNTWTFPRPQPKN